MEPMLLPQPASDVGSRRMQFMRFNRHGKDHIIGTDQRGNALLYNADLRTVRAMSSSLNQPKNWALSLTVGDSLYVMDSSPRPSDTMSFEALSYGRPSGNRPGRQDRYWHALPPPPYVFEPGYEMQVLTNSISKAGDWLLPFLGHAEYVPEYKLWFGLSYADDKLCATDLSAASMTKPPKLRNHWEWEDDHNPPDDWVKGMCYVVHLGSGKFCVARFFHTEKEERFGDGFVSRHELDRFAVFTGVEVERGGKARRGLRIVTHRSKRYRFANKLDGGVF
ncbi:hypothetical protein QOZ80_5AG0366800 [Eleusine coracana subsp. coracana]|nr:hypothetical protein QOZ80_5AG0366800 [Eleusine coracana subsp. coracana]